MATVECPACSGHGLINDKELCTVCLGDKSVSQCTKLWTYTAPNGWHSWMCLTLKKRQLAKCFWAVYGRDVPDTATAVQVTIQDVPSEFTPIEAYRDKK